ncbi:hypothetical protein NE865_16247 [Phthorimaea operculella]|nr:hypothetical protein NE865_16247 [Phthorimaea operculella]
MSVKFGTYIKMNTHLFLLGLLLCLAAVTARHTDPVENSETEPNNNGNNRAKGNGHRRKRYHMSYGYDYQPPATPFYYPPRRESNDRNQDLLPEIYRLLDEISNYIRRPPPPPQPQPIYIPYPVPYPMCNCEANNNVNKKMEKPTITSRFPDMDDTNQNWGIIDDSTTEDEGDGARPLSFVPIQSKRPMKRPPVALEHGTQHARAPAHIPNMCDVFSLSCCSGDASQQKRCFTEAGCADTFAKGNACEQERLFKIIDEYSKAYAPVN